MKKWLMAFLVIAALAGAGYFILIDREPRPLPDTPLSDDPGTKPPETENHPPQARARTVYVEGASSIEITLTGSDVDGDPLTFVIVKQPLHGTLSGEPPVLVYTPDKGYEGHDRLAYTVSDGTLESSPAAIAIKITYFDLSDRGEGKELSLKYIQPKLPPKPAERPLDRFKGKHPRILVPEGGIEELIKRGKGTHSIMTERIIETADYIIRQGPQNEVKNKEGPMRKALRKPGQLAWAYAATGDPKYKEAAITWALKSCEYPHWDIDVDLAAGHALVAIPQVYDWFYDDLTPEQKNTIREKVRLQGNLLASPFGPVKVKGGTWWTKSLLQNHGTIACAGLFAAAIVFYDELPDAKKWLEHAETHFDKVFSVLNEDGSSMEGMNYWAYGIEHLMLYADLAKKATGRDFFKTSGYIRNAGTFFLAHTTPWMRPGDYVIPFASPSIGSMTHGPFHILFKCAAVTRDPRIQNIGYVTWNLDLGPWSPFTPYCLVWFDSSVPMMPYKESPTTFVFPELGIVTSRSSWDEDATMLWFKCGPFQGRAATAVMRRNVCSPHARPDQTSFQIITRGERMTAYGNWKNSHQSVIMFRGLPQLGEGKRGLRGKELMQVKQPSLLKVTTSDVFDYMCGDSGRIYRAEAGVKKHRRHIVYLKPDTFFIIDDISISPGDSNEAPDIEWLIQTLSLPREINSDHYVVQGEKAVLDVIKCSPMDFNMSAEGPRSNEGYMIPEVLKETSYIRIHSVGPVTDTLMITLIHCRGRNDKPAEKPKIKRMGNELGLLVEIAGEMREITVDLAEAACRMDVVRKGWIPQGYREDPE